MLGHAGAGLRCADPRPGESWTCRGQRLSFRCWHLAAAAEPSPVGFEFCLHTIKVRSKSLQRSNASGDPATLGHFCLTGALGNAQERLNSLALSRCPAFEDGSH